MRPVSQHMHLSTASVIFPGVSYTTDKLRGNCTAGKIETNDFDVKSAGPKTVRIRNSKEFFYFDTKGVTYEGIVSTLDLFA